MEQRTLDPANPHVGFSDGTSLTCRGHATVSHWRFPEDVRPPTTEEERAIASFGAALDAKGVSVVSVTRLVLAASSERIPDLHFTPRGSSDRQTSLLVVIDGATAWLAPGTDMDAEARFNLRVTDLSITHEARGGWVAQLRTAAGATDAWDMRDQLFRTAFQTIGGILAPGTPPLIHVRRLEVGESEDGGHQTRSGMSEAPRAPRPPAAIGKGLPSAAPPVSSPQPAGAEPPPAEAPPAMSAPSPPLAPPRRTRGRSRAAPAPAPAPQRGASARAALDVERLPSIDFPDRVAAGDTHPLVVKLSDKIPKKAIERAIRVAIAEGADSATLTASLSAPGFTVEPDREQPITIGRTFDAAREQVTFTLTASDPGDAPVSRDIRVDFWAGNASVGGVTHWTNVTPKGWRKAVPAAKAARAVPFATVTGDRDCELVIRVEGIDDADKPPFLVSLRSRIPNEPAYESKRVGKISFTMKELSSMLNTMFASFAERFPVDGNAAALKAWRSDLLDEVETLGKWLWTQLPEALRTEYFRLYDAKHLPASLVVHSMETLIPWELIVPHRNGDALPRLGVAHVMGRWRPALGLRPRPQVLAVKRGAIANPKYAGTAQLVWSLLEANDVKQEIPSFTTMPAVSKAAMKQLLDRTDLQFVHFTGHGEYAKHADLSTLILENGETIQAVHFVGSKLLAQGQPIVYLNACEVGTSGVTMGQMGGFAAQCVEGGCSGIIAPYWAVADDSAREFAVAFYGQLKAGRSIGEALQALRKAKPKDPTYQAFAYLGDPWTRPQFA